MIVKQVRKCENSVRILTRSVPFVISKAVPKDTGHNVFVMATVSLIPALCMAAVVVALPYTKPASAVSL
jgi:hypothetical protein